MEATQGLTDLALPLQQLGKTHAGAHAEQRRLRAAPQVTVDQRHARVARPRRGEGQVRGGETGPLVAHRARHRDDGAALLGAPQRARIPQPVQQHAVLLRRRPLRVGDCHEPFVDGDLGRSAVDALQEVVRSAVQRVVQERCRVTVDVEDYRKRRRSQVVSRAQTVARRVQRSGKPEALEPMNAFERKAVHDAVTAIKLGHGQLERLPHARSGRSRKRYRQIQRHGR